MIEIRHRVNAIDDVKKIPSACGAEIDVRSATDGTLYLSHDPFVSGDRLDDWLEEWAKTNHPGPVILNVKEEGLEQACEAATLTYGVANWFFLDQSFPFLIKTLKRGENRCAVRVSEYETVSTALLLSPKAKWAWVDCFTKKPWFLNTLKEIEDLKGAGYKTCVVSPELQGETDESRIFDFQLLCRDNGVDAICTKYSRC
jgi:hypothetical protein